MSASKISLTLQRAHPEGLVCGVRWDEQGAAVDGAFRGTSELGHVARGGGVRVLAVAGERGPGCARVSLGAQEEGS